MSHGQTAETWTSLPLNPSIITLQSEGITKRAPNSTSTLTSATLANIPAGNGVRIRGKVSPTVSGQYVFAISGARNAALWVSTNGSRFNKQLVAWTHEPTNAQQWNKFSSQMSANIQLTSGTVYYIEAQVMSSAAGGHVEIGWKAPGETVFSVIPSTQLSAIQDDPLDLNDNNLPDTFEAQYGLDQSALPNARKEYGDPDNDGISNFEEFRLGSNPLMKESISNGLTLDVWREIQGQTVSHLISARSRFLSYPNATTHIGEIDYSNPSLEGKNYGARYRGFITAPATGTYYLWIAGDDDAQLWFADGTVKDPATGQPHTNRFGKQLVASAASYATNLRDYDLESNQKSRPLQLTAGQDYYIEVLHKNESIAVNHVSVAWSGPGFSRVVIPSVVFSSDIPEDGDKDSDALPDAWESAVGLSITDNGFVDIKQGQFGDFDNDGLSNLLEYQIGTNPKLADTDGDGLSDGDEINYYRTNPLVANTIATTTAANIILNQYSNSNVSWESLPNGSIQAYERRGWTEWTFVVAPGQEGIHEITLTGGGLANLSVPISFQINGELIAYLDLPASSTQSATIKQLTPWLHAGTHTIRFQSHNVRTTNKMVIKSIVIKRIGGLDANSNGIADWAEIRFSQDNKIVRMPSESLTSPAYIEGQTSSINSLNIYRSVMGGEVNAQEIIRSVDHGFFANVPLRADAPTDMVVSFQGGASSTTGSISWKATNIFEHNSITVRKGDSLRITAHSINTTPSGSFTLQASQGAPNVSGLSHSSDQPLVVNFDSAGTYTFNATWTPVQGAPENAQMTVIVREASFGNKFTVETYNRRVWTISGLKDMIVEADSELFFNETTSSVSPTRSFLVNAYNAREYTTIARVPETGEIIATGIVSAFSLARATATGDSQVVEIRPDGSQVIRFTIVGENIPDNLEIRLRMNYQGTVFPDGSRDLILRASDFSSTGSVDIYVETSSDPPQLCHSMNGYLVY
jgi:hypothetical protein